ncbi:MAG: PEP-CTERM sorting domain-containing protein [Phycisphaerae bacterium]|jgi:hypothetical protein
MNLLKTALSIAVVSIASIAGAATYNFVSTDGDYGTAANWQDANLANGVPTTGDTAYVRNGGVVSITASQAALALQFGKSNIDPNTLIDSALAGSGVMAAGTQTLTLGSLKIGDTQAGSFLQQGGTVTMSSFELSSNVSANLTVNAGVFSSSASSPGMLVNKNATFNLTGGSVFSSGSGGRGLTTGTVTGATNAINFSGGTFQTNGGFRTNNTTGGTTNMTISNDALVVLKADSQLGYGSSSGSANSNYSTLTMTGGSLLAAVQPATWDSATYRLEIAARSKAQLNMENGFAAVGQLRMGNGASSPGGTLYQTGGSFWCSSVDMRMQAFDESAAGEPDAGTKIIVNGGVFMANKPGGSGGDNIIGDQGAASFEVGLNGTAIMDAIQMGKNATSNSSLSISGNGYLQLGRGLYTANADAIRAFNFTGGTVDMRNLGNNWTDPNGTYVGSPDGIDDIYATAWNGVDLKNDGGLLTLLPGVRLAVNVGSSTLADDFVMTAGTWDIDVTGAGLADWANILNGQASLTGGLLNPILVGYTPTLNEPFTIAKGTSPAVVSGMSVSDPAHWQVQANGNNVELVYIPEPATMSLLVLGGLAMLRRRRN